jgi:ubiquinone/menaquinone biosynthesis C-methylase UbiE
MTDSTAQDKDEIRELVRRRYAAAATTVARQGSTAESGLPMLEQATCCGTPSSSARHAGEKSMITSDLYATAEVADLPAAAVLASLGCGNPTALAELKAGETVLDLGSGGGIDVLLSAKRVGPSGFAYGLDMTDEMLALAEKNRVERGVHNVRFLKGHIEHIPLPDASVDVVVSNCVINLSADKPRVLREAFRVLKPGGRFAVSDVVVQGELPAAVRQSMELFVGCVAGALEDTTYRQLLTEAGFEHVDLEVTRVHDAQDLTVPGGRLVSAFVRATKPVR